MKHFNKKIIFVFSLVTAFLLPLATFAQEAGASRFSTLRTPLFILFAIIVAIGLLILIEKLVPRKLKPIFSLIFIAASIFFGYMIYSSIMAPVEFAQVKEKRYTAVIKNLKDIRDAQLAHKTVKGDYAKSFDELETFIENAEFAITQRRDSSYTYFDDVYKIDKLKEVVIVDTLGFEPVKDSLFKGSDRYKQMKYVPYAESEDKTFNMKVGTLEVNGYDAPVFRVWVDKDVILYDQKKALLRQEKTAVSVDQVNGKEIYVGSLDKVTDSGNWPTSYEVATDQR